jgi:GrpB-like predicted nucleotidyltransferase (UPF0157 family)
MSGVGSLIIPSVERANPHEAGRPFRGGTLLGAERGESEPVEVSPYDPAWPGLFEELRARLAAAMGPVAVRIDHVGSTAVPGLAAKPVVDVQASVPDVDDETAYRDAIERQGFALRYREVGHRYFRPPPGLPRLWQVHVCTVGSEWERTHLLFRDYLRAHPDRASSYARLKRRLARRFAIDRIGYTDAKGLFIEKTLGLAEGWADRIGWRP